jgi:hypothetical protein
MKADDFDISRSSSARLRGNRSAISARAATQEGKSIMRMMLKVTVPTDIGNRAIKDGSLAQAIETAIKKLKPEASYFVADHGRRSALFFFDMQDSSEIPVIVEPLFAALHAEVELLPVMNAEELQKGLAAAAG